MRTMQRILATAALLLGALGVGTVLAVPPPQAGQAAPPHGKGRFVGPHPLAGRANAGYCYIDVPHSHNYTPDRPNLYQQVGDGYVFTGDPVPFGYEGQKTVFYGHHPVPAPASPEPVAVANPTFCFLKGPHYHDYPQPNGPGYKVKDDVVFYVGPIPPPVAAVRPQLEQATEVEYRPFVALRPKVTVAPPPEWPGVVWVAPPVVVAAPAPVVVAPAAPVVVAPAAPVVVAPVAPVVVAPAPVIIGPAPVIIRGHGKGKGWKGGHGWGHFRGKGHWKH